MPSPIIKENFNIIDLLLTRHVANGNGDRIAIIDEYREISFKDLLVAISNLPLSLPLINDIPKHSVVACLFDDSIKSAICFLSMIYNGLVPCYLNPNLSDSACEFYLKSVTAKLILIEDTYYAKFSNHIKNSGINCVVIADQMINQLLDSKSEFVITDSFKSALEDPIFCVYTSGTTGHPSAVLHRHKDVQILNENYAASILDIKSSDRLFTTSKMFFAYGLNNLLMAIYHRATTILAPKINEPKIIWDMMKRHKPSIFFSVPSMYNKLLNNKAEFDMPWLRACVSAGENLPEKTFLNWEKAFNMRIIDGIGSTETLSTFISNTLLKALPKSTGTVVKGFQCIIRDQEMNELGINQIGTLWVKGDTYPLEYMNNEQATKERFVDGWFNTNDLFCKDENNNFYYQGRLNDLIYRNGVWVFPARIEKRIGAHNSVIESAVLGYREELQKAILIAFIVVSADVEEIDNLCSELALLNEQDAYYQHEECLDCICVIDEIPKTFSGKTKKYELKKSKLFETIIQKVVRNSSQKCLVFDERS